MTKFKKIAISLSVIIMLLTLTLTALAVSGQQYDGTVSGLATMLANYDKAKSIFAKERSLDSALQYAATVDPEAEGLAEKLMELDAKELDLGKLMLAELDLKTKAAEKYAALGELGAYLERHPILETTEGYGEFYADIDNTVIDIAELYLNESTLATTAAQKHTALNGIDVVIAEYSPELSDEFIASVGGESFECAKLYLAAITPDTLKVAQLGANVRQLRAFLGDHHFSEELEGAEDFYAEYTDKVMRYYEAYEAGKAATQLLAYGDDYSSTVRVNLPFDEEGIGTLVNENNLAGGVPVTYMGEDCACGFFTNPDGREEHDENCGNKYYTVRYDKARNNFRTLVNVNNITKSMVFECDITTFDKLPDKIISFDDRGVAEGISWEITYFSIAPNGDIVEGKDTSKVLVKGAITPGEWTHISLVIDYITNEAKLYVDYQHVSTTINLENKSGSNKGYYYTPSFIRIGSTPDTAGSSFSIDNVKLYSGFAPRDLDWYSSLTIEEKFVYNVSQLSNKNLSAAARRQYYIAASLSFPLYWAQEDYTFDATLEEKLALKDAVDFLREFDSEKLTEEMGEENFEMLMHWYNKLKKISKGENTVTLRSYWLAKYDSYFGSIGGVVTVCDEYLDIIEDVALMREEISMEKQAKNFSDAVDSFYNSAAYARKIAAYEEACLLYPTIDMSYLKEKELYPKLYSAIERFDGMKAVLEEFTQIENSKRLLACLTFIEDYKTEESWLANYDELNVYVIIARDILATGVYDIYFSDLEERVEAFGPMNAFFYARLQEIHIEHITEQLALYEASDFYFEQFGILRAIQVYVDANDIDYTNTELVALIDLTAEKLSSLAVNEDEYDNLLIKNSRLFVEKCKGLVGSQDYLTMKKALTEASVYFYNMDVADANAQDALAIYIMRENELRAIEAYVNDFTSQVLLLAAADGNPLKEIIKCSEYIGKLCLDVPGAVAAVQQYESIVAAYDAKVAVENGEMININQYVAAVNNTKGNENVTTLVLEALTR